MRRQIGRCLVLEVCCHPIPNGARIRPSLRPSTSYWIHSPMCSAASSRHHHRPRNRGLDRPRTARRFSMFGSQLTFARRSQGLLSSIKPDRRRHKRIVVEFGGLDWQQQAALMRRPASRAGLRRAGRRHTEPGRARALFRLRRRGRQQQTMRNAATEGCFNVDDRTSNKSRQFNGEFVSIYAAVAQRA